MNGIAVAALLTLALATPSFAATAWQQCEEWKANRSTAHFANPKVYCVCVSGDANDGRIGVVRAGSADRAACSFPPFDPDGGIFGRPGDHPPRSTATFHGPTDAPRPFRAGAVSR